jgi:hypothetical protein
VTPRVREAAARIGSEPWGDGRLAAPPASRVRPASGVAIRKRRYEADGVFDLGSLDADMEAYPELFDSNDWPRFGVYEPYALLQTGYVLLPPGGIALAQLLNGIQYASPIASRRPDR